MQQHIWEVKLADHYSKDLRRPLLTFNFNVHVIHTKICDFSFQLKYIYIQNLRQYQVFLNAFFTIYRKILKTRSQMHQMYGRRCNKRCTICVTSGKTNL